MPDSQRYSPSVRATPASARSSGPHHLPLEFYVLLGGPPLPGNPEMTSLPLPLLATHRDRHFRTKKSSCLRGDNLRAIAPLQRVGDFFSRKTSGYFFDTAPPKPVYNVLGGVLAVVLFHTRSFHLFPSYIIIRHRHTQTRTQSQSEVKSMHVAHLTGS